MKPAPFEYRAPDTLEEALDLLAQHGSEAKILAGGQSLIPSMNFRVQQPRMLIDINRIPALAGVKTTESGDVSMGAMTRQSSLEHNATIAESAPLLHENKNGLE